MGRTMALATRYEVRAHVASSTVADMLPAICGSETLTTVVSRISMTVAHITAMATIHGLTSRWETLSARIRCCHYREAVGISSTNAAVAVFAAYVPRRTFQQKPGIPGWRFMRK